MTDKVQKIKDWISKTQDGLMDANGNFENPEHEGAYHILCNLDAYIDSLQEEHVNRTPADVESAMQEVEEKSRFFTEVHKGEDADTILAQMRGEEPVSNPTPNKKMSVERWKKACEAACCDINYRSHYGLTETRDDYFVDGVQWADEHPKDIQAEKDLELTWEDIKTIDKLLNQCVDCNNPYQEVLKRFKDFKERKEK